MEEQRRRPQLPVGRRAGEQRLQAFPRHVVQPPWPGVEAQRERVAQHLVEHVVEGVPGGARALRRPERARDPGLLDNIV